MSLACNLGRNAATPEPTIAVSTEAVESLEEAVDEAFDEAQQTGAINLVITESQLTSIVAFELEKSGSKSITDPQIQLDDGQIHITAQAKATGISAQARIVMEVSVDSAGRPVFEVVSAGIGPIPLPADLVSEIEARINRAFREQIADAAPEMFIESIVIEGGSMRITGRMD
jgi:uncharacterized protein YpmS